MYLVLINPTIILGDYFFKVYVLNAFKTTMFLVFIS